MSRELSEDEVLELLQANNANDAVKKLAKSHEMLRARHDKLEGFITQAAEILSKGRRPATRG